MGWGGVDGYLRPDQFLDHLTVIKTKKFFLLGMFQKFHPFCVSRSTGWCSFEVFVYLDRTTASHSQDWLIFRCSADWDTFDVDGRKWNFILIFFSLRVLSIDKWHFQPSIRATPNMWPIISFLQVKEENIKLENWKVQIWPICLFSPAWLISDTFCPSCHLYGGTLQKRARRYAQLREINVKNFTNPFNVLEKSM